MPRSCRDCLPMMPTELSAVLPARHIQEECGVFGVYAPETTDVAPLAYYALYALQHRGQESAGIAVNDDGVFTAYRDVGLVNEVFPAERLRSLGTGTIAVGHVRYGTTGSDNKRNVQPILVNHYKGRMALAHNGNLTNSHALRQELESQGSIFQTTTDSEVIAYIIVQERLRAPSIEEAVSAAMDRIEGAYSLVISSPTKLIAVRDPHGFRPLCMGRLRDGGVVFASESCALDAIGARFERDIRPGEIQTGILIAKESYENTFGHYIKYAMRNAMDIATLGTSVNVRLSADRKTVERARVAFGVAGPIPLRAVTAEAAAAGKPVSEELAAQFAQAVKEDINPRDSWRAAKDFRMHIAVESARRAFIEAVKLAGGDL